MPDVDGDDDGVLDCQEACPQDPDKTEPGECGCGVPDVDSDEDQVLDCVDNCADMPNADQEDEDEDGVGTVCDNCPIIPNNDQADEDDDGKGDMCWCDPMPLDCVDGMAGEFPCEGVDLISVMTPAALEAKKATDHWGWKDPVTQHEWVLAGMDNGTSFVDITNPWCPLYVGRLPTHTVENGWRDVKVYGDHAYIVSEAKDHGLQVFDLTQLRDVDPMDIPVEFAETGHDDAFGRAHNVAVNEDSGFLYGVDTNSCKRGLRVYDLADPAVPAFAGCVEEHGIAHDTQCVIYDGPDQDHQGKEICVTLNGWQGNISTIDVSDKQAPVLLATVAYDGAAYAHQGWFTEDLRYFLHDDELDEVNEMDSNTETFIWDMSDLDDPLLHGVFVGPTKSSDHNLYVKGDKAYQANYHTGLRILDLTDIDNGELEEVAYFDAFPPDDNSGFSGAWSNFPWFDDDIVTLTMTGRGLFVLREQ